MKIPADVRQVLTVLTQQGYPAYCVGGCVRDALLGRSISDWDVTTAALPQQVLQLFPRCVPTGIRHGTVIVMTDHRPVEVTTFRQDGVYADGRHPQNVRFSASLEEDLSRRDFTVNAMAVDLQGQLYDPFDAMEDLQRRILRCVGDPEKRFTEDALRMLRGVRFSAQLEFTLEEETYKAIKRCAGLCGKLSAERVRDEMEKTLCSSHPEKLGEMISLGLLRRQGLSGTPELSWLQSLPKQAVVRWAGLARLLPELELSFLRLDKRTETTAKAAAAIYAPSYTRQELKTLLSQWNRQTVEVAAAMNGTTPLLADILAGGECCCLKDLAIGGRELSWLSGKAVGQTLQGLLAHVLQHPKDNEKAVLLALAREMNIEKGDNK